MQLHPLPLLFGPSSKLLLEGQRDASSTTVPYPFIINAPAVIRSFPTRSQVKWFASLALRNSQPNIQLNWRRGLQTKYNMWCGPVKECFDNEEGKYLFPTADIVIIFTTTSPSASSSSMLPIIRAIIKPEALIKYHSIVAEFRKQKHLNGNL